MDGQYIKDTLAQYLFNFFFLPQATIRNTLYVVTQIYIHALNLLILHVTHPDISYSILLCFVTFKERCPQSAKLISQPLKGCDPESGKCCCQPEQRLRVPILALLSLNGTLQASYLFPWHPLSLLSVPANNVDPKWLTWGTHVISLEVPPRNSRRRIVDVKMHLCWTSTIPRKRSGPGG